MSLPSVHDVPIAELAKMATSEPQDEDHECACCAASCSTDYDLEPTALCNPCAQTAAIRLADHVVEREGAVASAHKEMIAAAEIVSKERAKSAEFHRRAQKAESELARLRPRLESWEASMALRDVLPLRDNCDTYRAAAERLIAELTTTKAENERLRPIETALRLMTKATRRLAACGVIQARDFIDAEHTARWEDVFLAEWNTRPGVTPVPVFTKFRADGWPLCPNCGDDELYTLANWPDGEERPAMAWFLERIDGCYQCNWKPVSTTRSGDTSSLNQTTCRFCEKELTTNENGVCDACHVAITGK